MKHHILSSLVLSVASTLPCAAHAYSNIYFFGDSLSDAGAFGGIGGLPANTRWTTNYGTIWTEALAARFGLTTRPNNPLNPHVAAGGNNYAQGSAQAHPTEEIRQPVGPDGGAGDEALYVVNLKEQVDTYLGQHPQADAKALYSVWIGGNDVIAAANRIDEAPDILMGAAGNTVNVVNTLKAAGAQTILLPNLPDVDSAPLAIFAAIQKSVPDEADIATAWDAALNNLAAVNGAYDRAVIKQALEAAEAASGQPPGTFSEAYDQIAPGLQQLASGYNQLVDTGLTTSGQTHGIIRADIKGLFREVLANPAVYGFTNVMGAACAGNALYCVDPGGDKAGYLFTDQMHPTPAAHSLIADYITGLLQAPYFAAGLPDGGLNNAFQLNATLNSRLAALRAQPRPAGTTSLFVQGAYGDAGTPLSGTRAHGQLYTLGIDFQSSEALAVGLAVSRQLGDTDMGSRGTPGSVKDRSTLLSAYASYASDNFWAAGTVHAGSGELQTRRKVALGQHTLTLKGSPNQRQYGLGLHGGYNAAFGQVKAGPVIGLDYARVRVSHFTEEGTLSSRMWFSDQKVESLIGRFGAQAHMDIAGRYTPYAKVVFANEFKRGDRTITSGVASTMGDWTTRLDAPDSNWMEWTAGLTAGLSKSVSIQGQISTTTGRAGGNQTAGSIGLAVSF
ncbi:autotransporter outer membrane beta-barrel domain-containing protein [Castellaniella ginsengisoli]|jgi:outer membrane lipase/esterase|uniref:Autotransporter domain-containing protein n=1 Tax=Castellaniella ginsengisoli TaxID=546114 RepID=A0AB39DH93_9BURK